MGAELVLDSVGKCDVDVRGDLDSGIILTGKPLAESCAFILPLPSACHTNSCQVCKVTSFKLKFSAEAETFTLQLPCKTKGQQSVCTLPQQLLLLCCC